MSNKKAHVLCLHMFPRATEKRSEHGKGEYVRSEATSTYSTQCKVFKLYGSRTHLSVAPNMQGI